MDDRVFAIAVGGLILVAFGQLTNADQGSYIVIGGIYAFLSTVVTVANRRNGKNDK